MYIYNLYNSTTRSGRQPVPAEPPAQDEPTGSRRRSEGWRFAWGISSWEALLRLRISGPIQAMPAN
ncbi:MAG: hypothetical protein Faunusvirus2_54 [Faunusvirus sp.]|jgi:hypothetical protein|uniref:Uncharacterized protein n=1 Tax=Faunusvirus sp. TaxID=2487766 RepID=A0A3G4ZW28_9VIRU|nr:MAG: hypothetical protein Faunusvirus2_54 [Faunusvirus sp.]